MGVGALFSIQLGFMNVGQNFTSGGHGVIMITTFPLWSSIFSHIFVPNDKLTKLKILGMIIAYGGIIILFWESLRDSKSDYFLGDILMLTSAMLLVQDKFIFPNSSGYKPDKYSSISGYYRNYIFLFSQQY